MSRRSISLCDLFCFLAAICIGTVVFSTSASSERQEDQSAQPAYFEAKTIALQRVFQTKRDWHISAYTPTGDDAETVELPIKICFWFDLSIRDKDCASIGDREYPHQNLTELAVVPLLSDPPILGVVVDSFFSGGGSGIAREVSISTYDKGIDAFSTLISLPLNEISEYKIISRGVLSGSIVTAHGLWQRDEGHFGDHRFWIQVYKYSEYYGGYEKFIGYLTHSKYSGEEIDVVNKEVNAISRIETSVYNGSDPLMENARTESKIQDSGKSVVSLFYMALAKGDGDLAASYVFPKSAVRVLSPL